MTTTDEPAKFRGKADGHCSVTLGAVRQSWSLFFLVSFCICHLVL